jgi:hemolysin activation/secretion protein
MTRSSLATSLQPKSSLVAAVFRLPALAAALCLAGLGAVHAQAPGAGDVLRETSRQQPQPPKADPGLPTAQPVRPALQDRPGFKMVVNGFRISGVSAIPETDLQLLLVEQLGKENTFNDLQTAVASVSNFYRAKGYFVARAYLPQQEIKGGIVEIAVLEGTVGANIVKQGGSARTKPEVLQGFLSTNVPSGSVVHESKLERAALLANDLPGVNATIGLDPGATTGTTDVSLEANEGKLLNVSVDLDNYGNRFTGQWRLGANVTLNSPAGLGDQASLRLMQTDGDLDFLRLSYQLPIGSNGTRAGVAYSNVGFTVCCQGAFNPSGEGQILSLFVTHPIVRSRNYNLYFNGGWDDKTSINVPLAGTSRERNIGLLTLGLNMDRRDNLGGGGVVFGNVSLATGRLGIKDPVDAAADAAGVRAAGNFTKVMAQIARTQRLSDSFSLYGGLNAQWANKNLDASEKFSLGGAQGVRAYPSGEAAGDEGYLAQVELRADLPFSPGGTQWQAFMFTDLGSTITNKTPAVAGLVPNHYRIGAYGLGLNITRAGLFQVRTMWAHKMGSNPGANPLNGNDGDGKQDRSRFWLQAVTQF